ncbi:DUF429 domain-containing protein [Halobacteria archaeon HArc-gm2]|nr:DUF429 domain-containing protein [Halobacteria archaeon HArc-gm2]
MLKNTFTFIPGIGEQTERELWQKGITTWEDLEQHTQEVPHNRVSAPAIQKYLSDAQEAVEEADASYFTEKLPQNKYWRLLEQFQDSVLYLDIETTGLSWYYDRITTVGTFDGRSAQLFVKDHNLDELPDLIEQHELLVTFNGKRFDQVFLKEQFPEISIPPAHLDLLYLGKGVGMSGPLKELESELDIERPNAVSDFQGSEAPVLWRQFLRGDKKAFGRLAVYNIYDAVNLAKLLIEIYRRKAEELQSEITDAVFQTTLNEISENHSRSIPEEIATGNELSIEHPSINVETGGKAIKVYDGERRLVTVENNRINQPSQDIDALIDAINLNGREPISVGIDLSGSENSVTGLCKLEGTDASLSTAKTDDEIIQMVLEADPEVISIDSPLTLPEGRCCVENSCECREHGIMREAERILKQRGVNAYPCLIDSMQGLTARGMRLSNVFEEHGYETIESFPGAAQDVLQIPRKQVSLEELEQGLLSTGIEITAFENKITNDELDALTSALVGHFYLADEYEHIGRSEESGIVVPLIEDEKKAETMKGKP